MGKLWDERDEEVRKKHVVAFLFTQVPVVVSLD